MTELKVGLRSSATCYITHITRTSCHKVYLILHVRLHFELNCRTCCCSSLTNCHGVILAYLWVNSIETSTWLIPRPWIIVIKLTIWAGLCIVEPFCVDAVSRCSTKTCRRKVAEIAHIDDVGTCCHWLLNRVNALNSGFNEAHIKVFCALSLKGLSLKISKSHSRSRYTTSGRSAVIGWFVLRIAHVKLHSKLLLSAVILFV